LSVEGHMVGRRGRSSPSGGKPRTWDEAPADMTQQLLQERKALVNTGELLWRDPEGAAVRVRTMQTKLHHWAVKDPDRLFDDVFNLVQDLRFPHRRVGPGQRKQGCTHCRC
jgi:hypothetical protein